MIEERAKWLRIAFIAGAVTDAGALLPMLLPSQASLVWGLDGLPASFWFAMNYGAALMLGWTVLLVWAALRPMERRFVAPMTALVVAGLALAEAASAYNGTVSAAKLAPIWALQTILFVLFATAYVKSGNAQDAR